MKLFLDLNKKEEENVNTPGGNYYLQLLKFAQAHIKRGEKMLEFVKGVCKDPSTNTSCDFCSKGCHSPVAAVPQPFPQEGTNHYLHVKDTPEKVNGTLRVVDDFNPRVQLNALISSGFDGKCNETIDNFCTKFIVEKDLVMLHLTDVLNRNIMKDIKSKERADKREAEKVKTYDDYDWNDIENNNLKKLVVPTLDKYIQKHALTHLRGKRKEQKIEGIKMHYFNHLYKPSGGDDNNDHSEESNDSEDSDVDDSDDDEVAATTKTNVQTGSDGEWEDPAQFRVSRYGRHVGVCR